MDRLEAKDILTKNDRVGGYFDREIKSWFWMMPGQIWVPFTRQETEAMQIIDQIGNPDDFA